MRYKRDEIGSFWLNINFFIIIWFNILFFRINFGLKFLDLFPENRICFSLFYNWRSLFLIHHMTSFAIRRLNILLISHYPFPLAPRSFPLLNFLGHNFGIRTKREIQTEVGLFWSMIGLRPQPIAHMTAHTQIYFPLLFSFFRERGFSFLLQRELKPH